MLKEYYISWVDWLPSSWASPTGIISSDSLAFTLFLWLCFRLVAPQVPAVTDDFVIDLAVTQISFLYFAFLLGSDYFNTTILIDLDDSGWWLFTGIFPAVINNIVNAQFYFCLYGCVGFCRGAVTDIGGSGH